MTEVMYTELSADDVSNAPAEIPSLCPSCEEMGTTKILLTKVPFYKEVILMSFSCDHCGCRNNEIQSGGKVQEQGIKITVKIENEKDLNRQVVKSEYAGVTVPELELQVPQQSQAGEITTVEGILTRVADSLKHGQSDRKGTDPKTAQKIDQFLERMSAALKLEQKFTLIVDDPSGNSFVENPVPYQVDPQMSIVHYHRNLEQNKMLALVADDAEEQQEGEEEGPAVWESSDALKNEVLQFGVECYNCNAPAQTNMKVVNIPYFKEVVVMATNCSECGHRTSEVKSASGIADKATKISLSLKEKIDLTRDVLKSDTCSLAIPELEMEVGMGALSGRFTTVEGLLNAVSEQLSDDSAVMLGDSADTERRSKMEEFLALLDDAKQLKVAVTLVLDDPAGNSYVEGLGDADDRLKIQCYDRSFEQNEQLGLNDMRTENYTQSSS